MTIASSGQMVFPTELNTELRRTGSLTMPDAQTRWLADRPTGALTFPTHFYGKSAYKLTEVSGFTSLGTSHTFSGRDFGPFYAGRRIQIIVECRNKASAVTTGWNLTSILIGGVSCANTLPYWYQDGSGSTLFFALAPIHVQDTMTATSGTVSFNTTQQTQCRIFIISIANCTIATDNGTAYAANTDPVTVSGGVTTASNGLLIAASISYKATGTVTASAFTGGGWTELYDAVTGGPNDFCTNISVKNRQSAGSKTVSCSWSGGTPNDAIVISLSRE